MDLPYRAEYAKSGRASCKGCKSAIGQGTLRIAVMIQSPVFDGKVPNWYHYMCFFSKQRPKTVDDIENFETLRMPDQDKIKEKIASGASVILPEKKGRGKKRDASAAALKNAALKDFTIEYAKSSRAMCRGCELKIMKEEIRISKKDFETEVGKKYGGQDMWHHLSCFAKLRSDLGFYEAASALPGFKTLSKEDQKEALKQIPAIKQEDIPEEAKKPKIEEPTEEEKLFKEHLKIFYKYRDQLSKMHKQEMTDLLEYNDQEIPVGRDVILDRLADMMTFGALEPCKICKGGQYVYNKLGYICQGDLTEWSKCNNTTKTPSRMPFRVPKELAQEYSFLKKYKYVPRTRIFKDVSSSNLVKKEDEGDDKPRVERVAPPLYNMEFVILGKVVTSIHEKIMAVIASQEEVEKMGSRMMDVRSKDIQVVPESFVDDAVGKSGKIPELIIEKKICDWGSDPTTRLPPEPTSSKSKSSKSMYAKSGPSKVKLTVKGGTAVDPDSGLEKKAHVYQEDGDKYTVVLGLVDIQKQRNSYYKLQLLKSDKGETFWVFRAWGRTGTTIGSNKLEQFPSLHLAKSEFCRLYEEKSGNMWEDRHDFVKVPGKMCPIDIDYGEEDIKSVDVTDASSNLEKSVSDLMRMIFDMKQMKQTMLELELDTEKMPLGKLSKKQILSAYEVLTELQNYLDSKNNAQEIKFIDGSNRFYTFIPHNFGTDNPPILKTPEMIKQKIEMLDSLMELEVAYSLLKSAGTDSSLDHYYSKLNTEIKSIPKDGEEFRIIQDYVKNTHAETHQSYELEILDVFDVKRQGEEKRFKPFKKLHNRMLLWHGSRTTNFAGILSQGLRIAPPEAPSTGYMFGKGIYFADMVSKSANYCFTSPGNNHGLLLLCEVALGNMYELTKAKYIEKLPAGKHSTKGLGKTAPDPTQSKKLEDVEVPLGKPVKVSGLDGGHLLYNEYIVYDVAQVKAKYLVKLNFKYKY